MLSSRIFRLVALMTVFVLCMANPAQASQGVSLVIDGQEILSELRPEPIIVEDRTMVPIRVISEELGMQVEWINELQLVLIYSEDNPDFVIPPINDVGRTFPYILIDDVPLISDVAPVIIEGRTMVPIRAIGEGLGLEVGWDPATYQVHLNRPAPPVEEPVEEVPPIEQPPAQIPEPGSIVIPEVQVPAVPYLGIAIMGDSKADAREMSRVAFDAVAALIHPRISSSEAEGYIARAREEIESRGYGVTAEDICRLTAELSGAGNTNYSLAQRDEVLNHIATTYYKLAETYLHKGQVYGIRGDIAFFQAAHETGWWRFGGLVTPDQNNYCGLSATGQPAAADESLRGADPFQVWFVEGKHGAFFVAPEIGVEAQLQHLYAYATVDSLPPGTKLLSPRFQLVRKGIAPNWEDLGGKWAVPGYPRGAPAYYELMPDPFAAAFAEGKTYGQTILNYYFRTGHKS